MPGLRPRLPRSSRALRALGVGVALLAACGAPRGGSDAVELEAGGQAAVLRIAFHDYRSAPQGMSRQSFVLMSESSVPSKEEFYSAPARPGSWTKLAEDDVVRGIADYLEDHGFGGACSAGSAPSSGQGLFTQAIEIERDGATRSFVVGNGSTPGEYGRMSSLKSDYLDAFNAIVSFQVFDNPYGGVFFDAQSIGRDGRGATRQ